MIELSCSRLSLVRLDFEHRSLIRDNRVKWGHVVARVVHVSDNCAFVGAVTDITAAKHAKDELRESETRFRAFMDQATDAFFVHDERGNILDANRQAADTDTPSVDNIRFLKKELPNPPHLLTIDRKERSCVHLGAGGGRTDDG